MLDPFLSLEDPGTFFFMCGFPDLASREPMKAVFCRKELWKREPEAVLLPVLERYDVVLVHDPDGVIGRETERHGLRHEPLVALRRAGRR